MRRLLLISALFLFPIFAIGQTTPNLNFNIPPTDDHNWGTLLNLNFSQLDAIFSGTSPVPGLSVTGTLQAPGLSTWVSTESYSDGILVVFGGVVYQSRQSGNLGNVPSASPAWSTSIIAGAASLASNENLSFSATPTFSLATTSSRIALSGNMAFTLPAGTDGQQKCLEFVHDNTQNVYTVTPPANVFAFLDSVGMVRAQQCFTYYTLDTLWVAQNSGVFR
jgi:hypothetical protein